MKNRTIKKIIFIFSLVIAILIVTGLGITFYTQHSRHQERFLTGTLPATNLDGLYQGTPLPLIDSGGGWRGKRFNAATGRGDNNFDETYKYPFRFYKNRALRDNREVIILDYNVPENPWYVRRIRDELVHVGPSAYLGKIHIKILPKIYISIGYFELSRVQSISGNCVVSGCSKEICSDTELFSICNFKSEYICYRAARCERQKDNRCGWTQTKELTECIAKENNKK